MAGPDQSAPQQGGGQEVAKLFQNVGQGLILVAQYVQGAAPQAQPLVDELMAKYEALISEVSQGGGGRPQQQPQPMPPEAGAADVRPM